MKIYTNYNRPPREASPHGGKSLTDAQYLKECDIDVILKRVGAGDLSNLNDLGVYRDVSGLGDFASALETVRRATQDFEALPSNIRDRFGNDPRALVSFLSDSANDEEAIKLGLKVRPVKEPTLAEQIVEGVTAATAAKAAQPAEG